MKITLRNLAPASILVIPLCFAAPVEDSKHQAAMGTPPVQAMDEMMGGSDMMSGGMDEQNLKQKQEFFLKMVELSDNIRHTKDEKVREQLKAEQLQLMKNQMQMMGSHCKMMMPDKSPTATP